MRRYFIFGLMLLLPIVAWGQGTAVRPGRVRAITTATTSNTATVADFGGWIEWRSPAEGNKTQILPSCNAASNGLSIGVTDGQANAATDHIVIQPASGQTISVDVSITGNGGSVQLVCNGAGNWIVASHFAGGEATVPTITNVMLSPDTFVADGVAKDVGALTAAMSSGSFTGSFTFAPGGNPGTLFALSGTNNVTLRANVSAGLGTHTVTIRATQANAANSPHDEPLTVIGTGPVPTITSPTTVNATEGQHFSYEMTASCQGPCVGDNAVTAFNVLTPLPDGVSQSGPLGEFISGDLPVNGDFHRWLLSLNAVNANGVGHPTPLLLTVLPLPQP